MTQPPTELFQIRSLLAARQPAAAAQAATSYLRQAPEDAEAHFLLGLANAELGELASASDELRTALSLNSEAPWTWRLALLNVLRDVGDLTAAEKLVSELRRVPNARPQLENAIGLTLQKLGRTDEAIAAFNAAVGLDRTYVQGYLNIAAAHLLLGAPLSAIASLREGIRDNPGRAELHIALGRAYDRVHDVQAAKAAYIAAIAANPGFSAFPLLRLGRLRYAEADLFGAITAFEGAAKLDPKDVELWNRLGNAYLDVAGLQHARRCFEKVLALKPDYAEVYDNLLLCLHYDPNVTPSEMYEAHAEWRSRFAPMAQLASERRGSSAHEPIRIGFLSRSLADGAIPHFLVPLLRNLDSKLVSTVGFNASPVPTKAGAIQCLFEMWKEVGHLSDLELNGAIRQERIDVLIDLDGHAPGNRLRALAEKPAPRIISWLDYFNTTALDAVDILIGDSTSTPLRGSQRFFERIVRIDPCRLCYEPPTYAPEVVPPPVLRNGYVTFGCFNRLSKLAEPVLDQWARLLHSLPMAKLVLKSGAFAHPNTRNIFMQRFTVRGIEPSRIELRSRSPHREMLTEYGDVDIALDPFPYNGGLTTCEALWMGLPVIALLGDSMISRQSAALLRAAKLDRWVAHSLNEWLEFNLALARDPQILTTHRVQARNELASSDLLDGAKFARKFTDAVREALREPPRH